MYIKLTTAFIVISCSFLLFMSCDPVKEPFNFSDFGYQYYPIEEGSYWIYQVDSVVYRMVGAQRDSTTGYIKEEIVERFIDAVGDTIFRIERSFSRSSDYKWRVQDEWATSKDAGKVTRTEENLKYIKLVFPLKENVSWDGNIFISEDEISIEVGGETLKPFLDWKYKVLTLGEKEIIGNNSFEKVSTIQNVDNSDDFLHFRYAVEKYAENVGLVHKKQLILDSNCIVGCDTLTWEEKAEKGYIMEMTLVEYGN